MDDIISLTGSINGPTSFVLVGVHGDERCGVEALAHLLPHLKIEQGRVLFGHGNPKAINANVRFTDTNLNRLFKDDSLISAIDRASYEYTRARFLAPYFDQADALLDIHASTTPESQPFIICESRAKAIASYLPIDTVVSGFDAVEPGGTDYYMDSRGKSGICVECGYLGDPQSTKMAEDCLIAFLQARGHIKGSAHLHKQSYIQIQSIYLTKTDRFTLAKTFKDFERIAAGQIIGTDGTEKVLAPEDSLILFSGNKNKVGDEAFLLAKQG